jgi:hypothetical protein
LTVYDIMNASIAFAAFIARDRRSDVRARDERADDEREERS